MTARAVRVATLLVAMSCLYISSAAAEGHPDDAVQQDMLARCIRHNAGGRAWLEKTLWGLRDQEAGWVGAEIPNADGSFDLGPLQINSRWVSRIADVTRRPQAHVRWWLIHDPCFNVEAARWIFLSGLAHGADYWSAVGAYHSPTMWRQRLYASGVAARLRKRFGEAAFSSKTYGR